MKKLTSIFGGVLGGVLAGVMLLLLVENTLAKADSPRPISIPPLPTAPLTKNSSVDDILALMLESDQKWNSMIAEYKLTTINPETNEVNNEIQKFWLDEKGKWARVEIAGETELIFVRNARTINAENRKERNFFTSSIPGTFEYNGFNPRKLLTNAYGAVVYLHPYAKALPTGFYDFLYPTGIAQSIIGDLSDGSESIEILGEDAIAGRKTIIVSRPMLHHIYWIDAETGVILKAQYFGDLDTWQLQYECQTMAFNVSIPKDIFVFTHSKDSKQVTPDEFYKKINGHGE